MSRVLALGFAGFAGHCAATKAATCQQPPLHRQLRCFGPGNPQEASIPQHGDIMTLTQRCDITTPTQQHHDVHTCRDSTTPTRRCDITTPMRRRDTTTPTWRHDIDAGAATPRR
ncbi:hypothetical protein EDB83DRAFT_179806 [Lactarius deliciosus]|nr:hypothetical protein EDB83DRAFT_179806 [Lactarius deliciosus]